LNPVKALLNWLANHTLGAYRSGEIDSTTTAYLVCGPESSGNRLLASVLCRSGCDGEGSTRQPRHFSAIPPCCGRPYVLIHHHNLRPWIRGLYSRGYRNVIAVIVVRDPVAAARSAVSRGHYDSEQEAYASRVECLTENLKAAADAGIRCEVVTYEGLTEPFLQAWLPMIGLPYVNGPLLLPGQLTTSDICNQNEKHYEFFYPSTPPRLFSPASGEKVPDPGAPGDDGASCFAACPSSNEHTVSQ